ncbi:YihY/virulence factor BrkB family protein [Arboricoccus pini]|nr:YihY/virulence factor BrkB family protein [Arboricoccus pini]
MLGIGALYCCGLLATDVPSQKVSVDPPQDEIRGREARNPLEIPPRGWLDIAWRTVREIQDDRVLAVGAGVAFFSLLALFPTITALVSIYGLFTDAGAMAQHLNLVGGFLPAGATDILADQMRRISSQPTDHLSFAFAFGLLLALWSANAGTKAIFDGLNVTYGEMEKRGFFKLNLLTLFFTIAGLAFVLVALAVIVGLPIALDFVGLRNSNDLLLRIGRWPLLFVVIVFVLAVIYRYGPSRNHATWRWITPGSVLAASAWILVSIGFSWYVSKFGTYDRTYGSLGTVIGFMTWMWISSVIVLTGAELNAEIEHQTARDSTKPPAKPMGARGAVVADNVAIEP